jgi:hypothetical protein
MATQSFPKLLKHFATRLSLIAFAAIACGIFPMSLSAQEQGPLPPAPSQDNVPPPIPEVRTQPKVAPPPPDSAPPPAPAPAPEVKAQPKPAPAKHGPSQITNEPPSLPVDQIIQQFAAREAEFKRERDNYTYEQTFVIQTIDSNGEPDGEYRMSSDIMFTPAGKRYEKVTYAPPPTLTRISLSEQDLADLEHVQPFVLTTTELPKYNITYVGRQQVDELTTYVFDVGPKTIEKNQRYFQGRVWVDDKDLEIVKTYGKAVPDIKKGNTENYFPHFETYRENIEGNYWFPTYTRADDTLPFTSGAVRIRMIVKYSNYKRFQVTVRIRPDTDNQ